MSIEDELKSFNLSQEQKDQYQCLVGISLSAMTVFHKKVFETKEFCLKCILKSYIRVSLHWKAVTKSLALVKTQLNPLDHLILELLVVNHISQVAYQSPTLCKLYGQEEIILANLQDKNVDTSKVFFTMMHMFSGALFEKVLDTYVKTLYHMRVEKNQVFPLMDFLIRNTVPSVPRLYHIYNDDEKAGYLEYRIIPDDDEYLELTDFLKLTYTIE